MTDPIKTLAERFCATPLPQSVCSDPCASDPGYAFPRSGTNLLTVAEAETVLRQVLAGFTLRPRVQRPFAYCCAEGGGTIEGCSCVNPSHGTAWFDA